MKREKGLYDELIRIDGIIADIINSSYGKRDRKEVIDKIGEYDGTISKKIRNLAYSIRNMYEEGIILNKPRTFTIKDGLSGKTRSVSSPVYYPDQIITHGIIRALSRVLNKGMYKYSCASIPGRGTHYAMKNVKKWIYNDKKNTKYYIKLDITKFFDSIDNIKLMGLLSKRIKDNKFLHIVSKLFQNKVGLPIGYYSSQWLANFYLQDLDHYIKQCIAIEEYENNRRKQRKDIKPGAYYYVRYMDDMVIFGRNKKTLHKIIERIKFKLNEFGLTLKPSYQVTKFSFVDKNGVERGKFLDFVGFRFYHNRTTIRKRIYRRINKVFFTLVEDKSRSDLARSILSYNGWIVHTNSYKMRKVMFDRLSLDEIKKISIT